MIRADLDRMTASELRPGMVLWWHGAVRPIAHVQHLPETPTAPFAKTAVTFADGYQRQALIGSGVPVDAATPETVG